MCLAVAALTTTHQASAVGKRAHVLPAGAGLVKQIRHYRKQTWRWQRVMGVRRTPKSRVGDSGRAYKRWVRDVWKRRAIRASSRAHRPPHKAGWLCIHRYERNPSQGWRTNTGNGYYGGLQMDISFQRAYGARLLRRKGTADRWTPLEQMWVAERAHRSGRGYYPWPNTARYCGLI
jgi:hypothetical protein